MTDKEKAQIAEYLRQLASDIESSAKELYNYNWSLTRETETRPDNRGCAMVTEPTGEYDIKISLSFEKPKK